MNLIAISCDQGSNFVRTFAQIGLSEPAVDTEQENRANLDQSIECLNKIKETESSDEDEVKRKNLKCGQETKLLNMLIIS